MAIYMHEIDDTKAIELEKIRNDDNITSAQYLQELADAGEDARYNLSILNLGMSLQILAIALDIKQNEIEKLFKLQKAATRDKKMEGIIKELNEKINLRYEFDEKEELIPVLYTYNGEGHFVFEKTKFLKLLNQEEYDELKILDNL